MKLNFDGQTIEFLVHGNEYRFILDGKTVTVQLTDSQHGRLDLLINGRKLTAYVSSDGAKRWVTVKGQTFVLTKSSAARRAGAGSDYASELAAPMPGQVRSVNISAGNAVTKGQTLMVLEAMKMEIRIQAPFDGIVKSVAAEIGQTVEREQILIVMER